MDPNSPALKMLGYIGLAMPPLYTKLFYTKDSTNICNFVI